MKPKAYVYHVPVNVLTVIVLITVPGVKVDFIYTLINAYQILRYVQIMDILLLVGFVNLVICHVIIVMSLQLTALVVSLDIYSILLINALLNALKVLFGMVPCVRFVILTVSLAQEHNYTVFLVKHHI